MVNVSKYNIEHKNTIVKDVSLDIQSNPKAAFKKLNKSDLEVIDIICYLCAKHDTTYISQSKIAKWTKLTRRQINRIILKICDLGIISKIYREYNTSIYFIHDFFRDFKIKKLLKKFIPSISLLPLAIKQLYSIFSTPIQRIYRKRLHYSPFNHDDENDQLTRSHHRGFKSIGDIFSCINIGVKNKQ